MVKKKSNNRVHKGAAQGPQDSTQEAAGNVDGLRIQFAQIWHDYFGAGNLEDWQRLCHDLGITGDLSSKNKCKKAMQGVWVNICDFLTTPDKTEVERFPSQAALARYTRKTRKIYPRKKVSKGSPLQLLMAHVF